MSFSLPGTDLYYLAADNLDPERYEWILPPFRAWSRIGREYEFDDRHTYTGYVVNMRKRDGRTYAYQQPPHGPRQKEKLERMIFSGEVVMLDVRQSPGALFYINEGGLLICTDRHAFRFSGAERILREYTASVRRRDYRSRGGKPRPTSLSVGGYSVAPEQREQATKKPETFATLNSKAVGRLLAAGGIYHQNPEMFADTARKLGGEAAEGFDQVLNQQTAGSLIALSSLAAIGRGAVHPASVTELEKLKSFLGTYKGEKKLLQNIDIVKMDYVKRSNSDLALMRREFNNGIRRDFVNNVANHPDVVARVDSSQLQIMKTGRVPSGYQVHHKLPLEDSGTNDFSNLVLIKDSPEHPVFTTVQRQISRSLTPEGSNIVLWPVPRGVIYP
ncbi:HNH endonuclease [Erwinia typographi]|uniref:HNH endonuclease n=1 Tax=Erwinia typographi TaxID=371042 RepID=A0A0A3YVQ6_9GAMM|nr:HNH endonuclease signature motif containing protein [Erwinia typographi]KGT89441.1 HNH endonuclease [Erwinia typographi]